MKIDHKKTIDAYRARSGEFRIVDVPPMTYLMVDGRGDPNSAPEYADAVAALYPIAYAMKFASKIERGEDYVVMPLEALWWADDMSVFTSARDKAAWRWTTMIMVPVTATDEAFEAAVSKVGARDRPKRLDDVRLETLDEGRCVQTLHIGSFDDEAPVLAHLHDTVLPERGLRMTGRHHEIYLSDARRVDPSRLRTILRQPVAAG